MGNKNIDYNNLTNEIKEIYIEIIEKYLKIAPVGVDKITPEIAKVVDDFMQDLHNCTKRIKIFANIFSKASTIIGLVKAIGKEAAKEELNKAFNKSISLPCYTTRFRAYANEVII